MKLKLLLLIYIMATGLSRATECADRFFKEGRVSLYLCQNYSNYNETRALLFKARTKALNEYIEKKVKQHALQNKKFEIRIYDQVLTYPQLELTQSKKGYFITISGFPSLQQLVTLVNYFAKPNWKPFFTANFEKEGGNVIFAQIDSFFSGNAIPDLDFSEQLPLIIWEKGNIRLDYAADKLSYWVAATQLTIKPTSSLPVLIKDRVLLFQSDSIFVLEGAEIIKQIKIDEPIPGDYDIYSFSGWVNICDGGHDNWVYSYSYDKNKFYKNPTKK
jgi:hypothetical protein